MKKILFLLLLASPLQAANETVYVVPGTCTNGITTYDPAGAAGAGSCTGGSAKVFSSLANGWAGISGSNNKIWVRTGTYTQNMSQDSGFVWKPGTSWSSFNSMENYNSEVVTVRPSTGNFVVHIQGIANKYIELKGLVIDSVNLTSYANPAIKVGRSAVGDPATFIRIQGNDIKNARGNCILVTNQSDGVEIIGNQIHGCGHVLDSGLYSYGIYMSASSATIDGNNIYNNGGSGIQIYDGSAAQSNITISRNNIHENTVQSASQGRGAGVVVTGGTTGTGHKVYSNLIWGNYKGIFLTVVNNCKIQNNVIYGNTLNAIETGSNSLNTYQNNIIYSNGSQITDGGSGTTFTTNLCGSAGSGCDSNLTLPSSPFVSAPTNFELSASNKARGCCTNLYSTFTTDYAGTARQLTGNWDGGAYRASTADSITLLAPNGGEPGIVKNTAYTVMWSTTGTVGNLTVKYSSNSGSTYPITLTGCSDISPIGGSASCTMPNTASTTARVRICNAAETICDASSANFSVLDSGGGSLTKIISANTSGTYTGTIQGVSDATIIQQTPTVNNGTSGTNVGTLFATKFANGDHANSLLRFDGISQIPAAATVTSVTLGLFVVDGAGGGGATYIIDIRRLLRNWVETAATWNIWAASSNWTTAGGLGAATDRTSTAAAQITGIKNTVSPNVADWYSVTQTSGGLFDLVQGWINGTIPNYGVHLERNGTGNDSLYSYLASSDNTNASRRPYLSVTYTTTTSTITLVSPSTGDRLAPGQPVPIRWTSSGVSGNLNAYISYNGGTYYQPTAIVANVPFNQSDAVWTVEGPSGNNVRFKVCDSLSTCSESGNTRIAGRYHGD